MLPYSLFLKNIGSHVDCWLGKVDGIFLVVVPVSCTAGGMQRRDLELECPNRITSAGSSRRTFALASNFRGSRAIKVWFNFEAERCVRSDR